MFSERVLKGKKILITGGGTGIGKSLGTRFLELGAEIVICGRREEVLKGTVSEWTKTGGKASYFVCDIRLADKVDAMFEEIWRATGPWMVLSTTPPATSLRGPRRCLRVHSTRSSMSSCTVAPIAPWLPASDGLRVTTRAQSSRF